MTKSLLMIAMVGLGGCGEPGDDPASAWAVGSYFAPPYHADGDKPAQGLNVHADGTWSHSTEGTVVREDVWTADAPGSLYLGDNHVPIEPNCRIIIFEGRAYFRDDAVSACEVAPLSPLEYCLVGEYAETESTSAGTIVRELEIDEDRFHRFRFDREELSDYVEFTNVRFWTIEGSELVTKLDETFDRVEMDAEAWAYFDGIRVGARHPKCNASLIPR